MRANSRYAEIAPESLKENQPAVHDKMQADGTLGTFLANRATQAEDMAVNIHQQKLKAGVHPGTALAEADSQAIRDNLLFPSKEEQESEKDGYHD
jgi:hypothetical protein